MLYLLDRYFSRKASSAALEEWLQIVPICWHKKNCKLHENSDDTSIAKTCCSLAELLRKICSDSEVKKRPHCFSKVWKFLLGMLQYSQLFLPKWAFGPWPLLWRTLIMCLGDPLGLAPWQLTFSKNTQSRQRAERASSFMSVCCEILSVAAYGCGGPLSQTVNLNQ